MTGQHTGHTRIRENSPHLGGTVEAFGEGQRRVSLEPADGTVAQLLNLKRAGYATSITGKWELAEPNTAGVPNRKVFDESLPENGTHRLPLLADLNAISKLRISDFAPEKVAQALA